MVVGVNGPIMAALLSSWQLNCVFFVCLLQDDITQIGPLPFTPSSS